MHWNRLGIPATRLAKHDGPGSGMRAIDEGKIDLVINVSVEYDEFGRPDGRMLVNAFLTGW